MITPDDHSRDPGGFFLTQVGHAAAGTFTVYVLCIAFVALIGEIPVKWVLIVLGFGFYLGVIELWIQGWRRWDTIEDTAFFGYGFALPMLTFSAETSGGGISGQIDTAAGVMAWGLAHLAGGTYRRWWRKENAPA